jgi:hypothetical protein
MKRPIENNSSPGQAVYEPFSGSGTTIIAAEITGRSCHAMELLPQYVDVAVERWQAFTGETARLEAGGRTFAAVAAKRRPAKKMGRRSHRPDAARRRQVEAMAAYGILADDISRVVGVDPKTLRKYYRDELDLGETKANAQVAGFLFNSAKSGNVTAQIFWLKTRARWRQTPTELRHSGVIGHKDMCEYSDEELMAIIREGAAELGPTRVLPMKNVSDTEAQVSSVNYTILWCVSSRRGADHASHIGEAARRAARHRSRDHPRRRQRR